MNMLPCNIVAHWWFLYETSTHSRSVSTALWPHSKRVHVLIPGGGRPCVGFPQDQNMEIRIDAPASTPDQDIGVELELVCRHCRLPTAPQGWFKCRERDFM